MKIVKKHPEALQVWFWDQSGFSLRVVSRKKWTKKGKRKQVRGDRRKGKVNVMGGLRATDKKRVAFFVKKSNGDSFLESLKSLHEMIVKEWVEQGNRKESFSKKGPKVIIIIDNASFHKRKDIAEKIEAEMPNLRLEYLPYGQSSLQFNRISMTFSKGIHS